MRVLDNDRSNPQKLHAPLNLHAILQLLLPHILRPLTLFPRDSLPNEHSSSGHDHQNHLLGQAIKIAESCARRKRATSSSDATDHDTLPRNSPPFYGPVGCLTSAHQPRPATRQSLKLPRTSDVGRRLHARVRRRYSPYSDFTPPHVVSSTGTGYPHGHVASPFTVATNPTATPALKSQSATSTCPPDDPG